MNKRLSRRLPNISKRAKVQSDKPAYKEKKKTDKGYVWLYDEKHVQKRWKEKKEKMKSLEKNLQKVRAKYQKDLTSGDDRCRAVAAIVGIMDDTAMRIGNEESAKEGTFGASTLKVKHVKGGTGNMTFDFPGKGAIEQNVVLKNNKVIKVIRDLMKGKKANDFIFEIDGNKIWDRTVNRYLKEFNISAKDLRGFHANRLMKEQLKKKDFKDALKEVAEIVGHEEATLKNQYLDPELVEKHEGKEKEKKEKEKGKKDNDKKKKKAGLSIRAEEPSGQMSSMEGVSEPAILVPEKAKEPGSPTSTDPLASAPAVDTQLNVSNIHENARVKPILMIAWQILAPFLPAGARLRNSNRTWREQRIIIRDYWANKKWRTIKGKRFQYRVSPGAGFFATMFPNVAKIDGSADVRDIPEEELRKAQVFMIQTYDPRKRIEFVGRVLPAWQANGPWGPLKIAWKKSKHIGGNAIDIDNAPLKAIEQSVMYVMSEPTMAQYISISGTAFEPDQGNFHVSIVGATPISKEVHESVLRNYLHGYPLVSTQSTKRPQISKRAELTPEDSRWVDMVRAKRTGMVRPYIQNKDILDVSEQSKRSMRARPKAKFTPAILDAWRMVEPFLPEGAVMTSGARTQQDQIQILKNYWRKATRRNLPPHFDNLDPNSKSWSQVSRLLKKHHRLNVSPPYTKRPEAHLRGRSFDISGADLDGIAHIIRTLSRDRDIPVTLTALVEDANNAVHVNIKEATYDSTALSSAKQKYRVASISKRDNGLEKLAGHIYEDLISSNPPQDVIDAFRLDKRASFDDLDDFSDECFADDEDDVELDMGFGKEDEIGDWFEKSPMFRWREDIPDFDIHEVDDSEAKKLAEDDPEKFFYRGLHKDHPDLEAVALKGMINDNAKFFFVFLYHEREEDEFKKLTEEAAEALSLQDSRGFFYYHLHHKFPELGRGAIIQLIDTNPDSFFDLGLQKDYPDLEESAGAARNIKDPNKVELEQPEWLKKDTEQAISLRDRNASKNISKRAGELMGFSQISRSVIEELRNLPGSFDINEEESIVYVSGEIPIREEPEMSVMWTYTTTKDQGGSARVLLKMQDMGLTKYYTMFTNKDNNQESVFNTLKDFLNNVSDKAVEVAREKSPGIFGDNVIPLFKQQSSNISKRAKDKPKAGVFMKLPRELAKQFPSLGKYDDSVPHVTTLFIGLVPEEHEILLEEIVKRVAMEHDPFELALDEKVSYFPATKHSDDCKVAKLNVVSPGLKKLHKALKKAITGAKMHVDDHFPDYKPHVTLEYMDPPKEKYDTEIPSGSWTADKIEIWNGDKKMTMQLGRKKISSRTSANKSTLSTREL